MESFKISTNSWHWKVYMFTVAMWAKFLNNPLWRYERPNLCAYLRMILVYQPIVLLLNVAIYASPLWAGMLIGHYYGYWIIAEILPYLGWTLVIIALMIVAVVAFFGIMNLIEHARDLFKGKQPKAEQEKSAGAEGRSFTHAILQGIADKHDMLCRPIVPVEPEVVQTLPDVEEETQSIEEGEMESYYVLITHRVALTLGKMIILSVLIAFAGWVPWHAADNVASKESLVPREICVITESRITGFGETSSKGAGIEIRAVCSFGTVTETSSSISSTIAFAVTKPAVLPCYTKKYQYTTVSGCDLPK